MSNKIENLLRELETKTQLSVGGESLPDEGVVRQLADLSDPFAVPALLRALERARRFGAMCRRLESTIDPTTRGSASPLLAAMLAQQTEGTIKAALAKCQSSISTMPTKIVDLRPNDFKTAQETAATDGARIGDMHVGYKVISVKNGAHDHLSIVMAKNVTAERSANYVVWTLDRSSGGGYRSGYYTDEIEEAKKHFESRNQ